MIIFQALRREAKSKPQIRLLRTSKVHMTMRGNESVMRDQLQTKTRRGQTRQASTGVRARINWSMLTAFGGIWTSMKVMNWTASNTE